jgi:hypothetical protein
VIKRVLCPQRLRRVPEQFSWIDHRLVRDRPLYQVLALDAPAASSPRSAVGQPLRIGEILRAMGRAR